MISPMNTNRRYFSCLLGAMLMLAPLSFTSCKPEPAEIKITIKSDYSQVIEAINSVNNTLTEKLAAIESAVQNGLADNKTSQELIQQALASLSGTLAEKLAAIESAVQAQTTSLEMKLALIEAAVKEGLASGATQQNLLKEAIESLGGTLAEKLAAIETAIKEQTSSLEAKLGLIEAAVRTGLADTASAQSLIKEAIESVGGTLAEKIAAVEKAVGSQTTELAAKLALIETAVKEGFSGEKGLQELIKEAIETLNGTAEEKLEALERAVTSLTSSLETKLGAIETALNDGIGDVVDAQGLIREAISSLPGTLTEKLSAVEQAITSQTSSLDTKLGAIEQAVAKGFTDSQGKQDLIEQAIRSLGDTVEEVIGDLQEAMSGSLSNLETKLETIGTAVTDGFADANTALGLIKDAIDEAQKSIEGTNTSIGDVTKALRDVIKAIEDMDKTISDDVVSVLSDILDAIANAPDYSTLLADIKDAIEKIDLGGGDDPEDPYNGHKYVDLGMTDANNKPVYWATCNVGAENPDDCGDYFAWGDTEPNYQSIADDGTVTWKTGKTGYDEASYKWTQEGQSDWLHITKYTFADGKTDGIWYSGGEFVGDGKTSFEDYDYEDDAARANWGGKWRTPTAAECDWLIKNCNWTWKTTDDSYTHNGYLVEATNGNSIFIPAAGWYGDILVNVDFSGNYWSSSLSNPKYSSYFSRTYFAVLLNFSYKVVDMSNPSTRCYGLSIRPVVESE